MSQDFKNEAFTNFSNDDNKKKMEAALYKVKNELAREYPIIIDGKKITCSDKIRSTNPSNPQEIVGIAQKGTRELATEAIQSAWKTFDSWKLKTPEERADYLFKMASKIRDKKFYFSAWLVYEIGKSWAEADGDVAEAIDFCEFYAREAIRYGKTGQCHPQTGESNYTTYIPLGVGAIIPPWNFPFAILVGMTTAAIVTGNTVVLKPASDTPIVASKFMEIVEEVNLPNGVINFVSGSGQEVGETLITHPQIRFISFTGSREVGLHIVEEAGKTRDGQKWIKRVVAEMGGKDAIIVDSESDIDTAVEGTALSAFGFQGQKCSACSRVIVDEKIYETFLEKLKSRVEKISVGAPENQSKWMGPVSSKTAYTKIMSYIEIGKCEGKLICGGEGSDKNGYFIQPTVIADVSPIARIAKEEIFGPVLAVIKSKNFNESIGIFNNTDYGLTGGVFTKNKEKIVLAIRDCFCGNFYINRKITGALVASHPFGGYNMSGTCSKAGGKDYLLQFLQTKSVCEKI